MRTLIFLVGFVVFGLVLFFVIGDVLVDRTWFGSLGNWAWLAAIGLIVADVFVPVPTTVVITVMGQKIRADFGSRDRDYWILLRRRGCLWSHSHAGPTLREMALGG